MTWYGTIGYGMGWHGMGFHCIAVPGRVPCSLFDFVCLFVCLFVKRRVWHVFLFESKLLQLNVSASQNFCSSKFLHLKTSATQNCCKSKLLQLKTFAAQNLCNATLLQLSPFASSDKKCSIPYFPKAEFVEILSPLPYLVLFSVIPHVHSIYPYHAPPYKFHPWIW